MKFLLDTNIFIPLEPATQEDIEKLTTQANEFVRLVGTEGHQIYLHPESQRDINNDKDSNRKFFRTQFFSKYPLIPDPPCISSDIIKRFGAPKNSHDHVDFSLLTVLQADAIDFLVTEDKGIHTKAAILGIKDRVLNIPGAIYFLQSFLPKRPLPLPDVKYLKVHALNDQDPIFDSLRADYNPEFDEWLRACKRGHRDCWIVEDRASHRVAGLCIIKDETGDMPQCGVSGKILKLCTFKVSEDYVGRRYGELLLKAAFQYAHGNGYNWVYVTVLPKHTRSVSFFQDFGFLNSGARSKKGEFFLVKAMVPPPESQDSPLAYHIKYGPYNIAYTRSSAYIVPIRPVFHDLLFPEMNSAPGLFDAAQPYGNSIRKAYLSGSQIRRIEPGSVLFFYRSNDLRKITTVGVVENTKIGRDPDSIAGFVGKRTVYSYQEIKHFCNSDVLAILFRQAFNLKAPIGISEIIDKGFLGGPPQSIATLSGDATKCLVDRIQI